MSDPIQKPKSPFREIVQPFIDLVHAPRALWGINLSYVIEGMVYFGILINLAIHFSDFIFQGVPDADVHSHRMVGVLTAGITLAMVFLGFVADKWGIRIALISAFIFMLAGRILISGAPNLFGLQPAGLWSPLHLVTMAGIVLVMIGYGMYQPAAYAGVRQFTTPKTAGMAFAMLYALMNLGGWLPTFAFLLRDENYLNLGIPGTYWVYTGFTAVALLLTVLILSRKTVARAIATAKEETAKIKEAEQASSTPKERRCPYEGCDEMNPVDARHCKRCGRALEPFQEGAKDAAAEQSGGPTGPIGEDRAASIPMHLWGMVVAIVIGLYFSFPAPWWYVVGAAFVVPALVVAAIPGGRRWIARHPLANSKFFFFIFALIPVQTLFTYNWFVLPQYISRAYEGWIGEYYEIFSSLNALLIFIVAPIIAAVTYKRKVYNMMILGTFIMAAPAFLLVMGPNIVTLTGYIVLMTIGEAMWQPRFLQYAAEIAPEGRTGVYMGVAQLPWFLTKVLVPLLYSGKVMAHYCPADGPKNTEFMWFVFGCIAITSTILLLLARSWVGKDFKTKSDE